MYILHCTTVCLYRDPLYEYMGWPMWSYEVYKNAMNNEIQIQDGHITVLFSIHVLKCLSNEKQILLIES